MDESRFYISYPQSLTQLLNILHFYLYVTQNLTHANNQEILLHVIASHIIDSWKEQFLASWEIYSFCEFCCGKVPNNSTKET